MSGGWDTRPNAILEALRSRPVETLDVDERTQLFRWLHLRGYQSEYEQKLARLRRLGHSVGHLEITHQKPLLTADDAFLEHTENTPIQLSSTPHIEALGRNAITAKQSAQRVASRARELDAPSADELALPPTESMRIETSAGTPVEPKERKMEPPTSFARRDRINIETLPKIQSVIPRDSLKASIDDSRALTPEIKRPRLKALRVDGSHKSSAIEHYPIAPPPLIPYEPAPLADPQAAASELDTVPPKAQSEMPNTVNKASAQTTGDSMQHRSVRDTETDSMMTPSVYHGLMRPPPMTRRLKLERKIHGGRYLFFGAFLVVVLLAAALFVQFRREVEQNRRLNSQVHAQFQTGNHRHYLAALELLREGSAEVSFSHTVLGLVLPLIGREPLVYRHGRSRLEKEIKLRSSLGYMYQDYSVLEPLPNLFKQASALGTTPKRLAVAEVLYALAQRDFERARQSFEALPSNEPHAHLAWVRGVYWTENEDIGLAEKSLRRSLTMDFEHPFAGLSLASLLEARGDSVGAARLMDQILASRPDFVLGRLSAARIGLENNRRRKFAKQELMRLERSTALTSVDKNRIAIVLAREDTRNGLYASAEKRLLDSLKTTVQTEKSVLELSNLYFAQYRLQDIHALLEKRRPDEDLYLHLIWSRFYFMMGMPQEAINHATQVPGRHVDKDALYESALALKLLLSQLSDEAQTLGTTRDEVAQHLKHQPSGGKPTAARQLMRILLNPTDRKAMTTVRTALRQRDHVSQQSLITWRLVAAHMHYQNAEFLRGIRLLSKGVAKGRATPLEHWQTCRLRLGLRQRKMAERACENALTLFQFKPARQTLAELAELREQPKSVIRLLTSWPSDQTSDRDDNLRLIRAYFRDGRIDQLDALGRLHSESKSSIGTLLANGLADILTGRPEDGLARLRRVGKAERNDHWTLTLLGHIFRLSNRPREAQVYLEQAMKLTKEPFSRIELAQLFLDHGQPNEAIKMARTGESLAQRSMSPSSVRARSVALQARAQIRLGGRTNLRDAYTQIVRSLLVDPKCSEGLIAKGLYYEKQGQKSRAKRAYRRALSAHLGNSEALYRLGRLLYSEAKTRSEGQALLSKVALSRVRSPWTERSQRLLPERGRR